MRKNALSWLGAALVAILMAATLTACEDNSEIVPEPVAAGTPGATGAADAGSMAASDAVSGTESTGTSGVASTSGMTSTGEATSTGDVAATGDMTTTASTAGEEPPVSEFTAKDYSYSGPDSIQGGLVTLKLTNEGEELHHMSLLKLEDGKTVTDLSAALEVEGPPPSWIKSVGGPNAIVKSESAATTLFLEPGKYVMLCFVPTADGTPHFAKGMVKALTVTAAGPSMASAPKADVDVKLVNFAYGLDAPTTAGTHVFHVSNLGTQDHELTLIQLAPDKTALDFVNAFLPDAPAGPPPGKPMGGVSGLAPNGEQTFSADFEPGNYALICFIEDPATEKMHAQIGMTREFTIK